MGEEQEEEYSDEDDEMEEGQEQQIREIGAHPMMERVQVALFQQLKTEDTRLNLEILEKNEALKRIKKRREDVGVDLYTVQQQLAKLQMQLESTIKEHADIASVRVDTESDTVSDRARLEQIGEQVKIEVRKLAKHQTELDAVNTTLQSVEKYNEEMKSEIAVIRRATYKAEEAVSGQEKTKQMQDVYIDTLNEQVKSMREQHALYKAQLVSQKQETAAAARTLTEAFKEMEAINFEKKQLMAQWKSSLIGIQRRDEALQATNDALAKQEEQAAAIEAEVAGVKGSIREQQVKNEDLTGMADKTQSEIQFLQGEIQKLNGERDKLAERYQMLRKSLEQTDTEAKRVDLERKNLLEQCTTLDQNFKVVEQERQEIEKGIALNASTQTTVSKAAQNLAKNAAAVQTKIHVKEQELGKAQNEMSRIKVDALNTESHNKQLSSDLQELVSALSQKDKMIEKYELEIRQRNDEVEKKMYVVDRLNRKFEQLTGNQEDENHGPLEAAIRGLQKSISDTKEDNQGVQREWLKMQTQLVSVMASVETLNDEMHENTSKLTIHQQRRLRLDNSIVNMGEEVQGLRKEIEGMHGDMTRLNRLISQNKGLQEKLASATFNAEKEFVAELREMETASIQRDSAIKKLKVQRAQILEDIVESERQLMLWEKKIQLERETQDALDPEVGMAEARSMEKEIHRMKLRFSTLKREQERMIKEMELAIDKRETIAVRNRGRKKTGYTKSSMNRRVAQLKKMQSSTEQDSRRCAALLQQKEEEIEVLGQQLQEHAQVQEEAEAEVSDLQQTINDALYEKQKVADTTAMMQRMLKRYKAAASGNFATGGGDLSLLDAQRERDAVLRAVRHLKVEYPQFAEVLGRVGALTEIPLPN